MAKFIISNANILGSVKQKNLGFKTLSDEYCGMGIYAQCYNKEVTPHVNCFKRKDDFLYLVGSYIVDIQYDECRMFELFLNNDIEYIKKHVIGMWSACLCINGKLQIFNDYYGLYDTCYFCDNRNFVIGNALGDVALLSKDKAFNEYGFVMEAFQSGSFPGETIFKSISKLKRDELIEVINGQFQVSKLSKQALDIEYKYVDERTAIEDIADMLRKYAGMVKEKFGSQALFLTGGLDSRLIFGSFNSVGSNFNCYYGVAPGSEHGDRVIVDEICSKYGKSISYLDWTPSVNLKSDDESVFNSIDFNNYIAGGNFNHLKGFKECSKKNPFMAFGYFCEAIRLREWAENKGKFFTLDDFIDNYYIARILRKVYPNYAAYKAYITDQFKSQLQEIGITDFNHIPVDKFERFRWMMSRFCDSRVEFMLNNFSFAFSIMSVPYIHQAILSLPADVIRGGVFQVKLTYKLDPVLVNDFNVFSHRREYVIDKNFRKIKRFNMKNIADGIFEIMPFAKPILLKVYRYRKARNIGTNQRENLSIKKFESLIPTFINLRCYNGNIDKLKSILFSVGRIYSEEN